MFKHLIEASHATLTFDNFAVPRSGGYRHERFERKV